jgi:hypothetical protein
MKIQESNTYSKPKPNVFKIKRISKYNKIKYNRKDTVTISEEAKELQKTNSKHF